MHLRFQESQRGRPEERPQFATRLDLKVVAGFLQLNGLVVFVLTRPQLVDLVALGSCLGVPCWIAYRVSKGFVPGVAGGG